MTPISWPEATEDEQQSSASSAKSARGLTVGVADPADGKSAAVASDTREAERHTSLGSGAHSKATEPNDDAKQDLWNSIN